MIALMAVYAVLPPVFAVLLQSGRLPYRHLLALVLLCGAAAGACVAAPGLAAFTIAGPALVSPSPWLLLALGAANGVTALGIFFLLRTRLRGAAQPQGFYRDVLDFFALADWHPAVRTALVIVLAAPPLWIGKTELWVLGAFARRGLAAFASGDVQSSLEGIAAAFVFGCLAGLPLVFCFHLLCRRLPGRRVLPWLLLPLVPVGAVVGFVILVTIAHFAG